MFPLKGGMSALLTRGFHPSRRDTATAPKGSDFTQPLGLNFTWRQPNFTHPWVDFTAAACRYNSPEEPLWAVAHLPRRRKVRELRFRLLGEKLRSLPCSSFPHQTRYAGLWRGPRWATRSAPSKGSCQRQLTEGCFRRSLIQYIRQPISNTVFLGVMDCLDFLQLFHGFLVWYFLAADVTSRGAIIPQGAAGAAVLLLIRN